MIRIQKDWYKVSEVRADKDTVYVFGDNLVGVGKGGQAIIRDLPNAFGIPTKRAPSMNENAFFGDKNDEYDAVLSKLQQLFELSLTRDIVFPKDGIGTGLAQMDTKSPKLFRVLVDHFEQRFNILMNKDGLILKQEK